ncbi:MAG: apolipoprotein N-acyltransferase [Paracoccus sp. (in: a-proteobacteria)]|uniref:apolipoprotein N-acyltransferase n=1 Tax=Paracoccus sp. TaxID=267 RepID=UPI0026DEAC8B|nr:apolipoprotein N-acyltransferase [Paracoccus sp. (in: a-proteobacteria)]MDO5621103.1 apolipoprotein N-acyltransferase [Paracoccus sp. (in: a-proteobacteria)]
MARRSNNPNRRPALIALAADLALGVVAALGQAPWGLWPATLIALALGFYRIGRAPGWRATAWHGFALGLGYFGLAMSWITEPFFVQPEIYGWMAPFALFFMAAGGGIFWAVPAALAGAIWQTGVRRAAGMAALLVLSEWLRGWIFTGLPWAEIGHIWIGQPPAQLAATFGALGLVALTGVLAGFPVVFGWVKGGVLSGLLLATVWVAGDNRLQQPLPPDQNYHIRLVQPDAVQALKWDSYWSGVFYQRLLDLSAAAPQSGPRPDLVIWPETAVSFLLNDAGPVLSQFTTAAGAPVLTGIQRAEGSRWYNSLVLVEGDQVTALYDKFHLVPFGEYIPWGDELARIGIRAFAAQTGNGYSPGPGAALMSVPGGPDMQPLICYEAIFPRHLLRGAARPGWLLQVTNDSWFGTISGPYQHLAQARLRAIETGLPLLRAANTGISAVINAHGNLRGQLGLGQQGFIDTALPGALPATLWMRWGDWPVLLGLVALLGILLRRRD